jgi:hypothetical protein
MGVLMMEAVQTSETSVNFYEFTQRYNPEDSRLRGGRVFLGHTGMCLQMDTALQPGSPNVKKQ